jgi:hypothetical protein
VNRRASQNKSSGRVVTVRNGSFPKTFQSNVRFKHKFRFIVLSATVSTITRADMLDLLFVNKVANNNARLFSGIKLNRVEVYAVGGSAAALPITSTTVSLEWLSNYGPSNEYSDTGNQFEPGHLVCTPPPMSLASFWSLTGSNETETLFTLTAPVACIVDIDTDIVLNDGETPVNIVTVAAGTIGLTYASYLDFSSTKVIQPVSYESLL